MRLQFKCVSNEDESKVGRDCWDDCDLLGNTKGVTAPTGLPKVMKSAFLSTQESSIRLPTRRKQDRRLQLCVNQYAVLLLDYVPIKVAQGRALRVAEMRVY